MRGRALSRWKPDDWACDLVKRVAILAIGRSRRALAGDEKPKTPELTREIRGSCDRLKWWLTAARPIGGKAPDGHYGRSRHLLETPIRCPPCCAIPYASRLRSSSVLWGLLLVPMNKAAASSMSSGKFKRSPKSSF